ncbi:MAG: 4Fe-4S binding protein [Kiritimatiellae bacterium]|nr:4Fe-4S binding protein [Kiritimatiellia bacterium]MDD4341342.1 4Fe-4S binding protein [Kiritimatiellia bacterium]
MMRNRTGILALAVFLGLLALAHVVRRAPSATERAGGAADPLAPALAARVFPGTVTTQRAASSGWTFALDSAGRCLGAVASSHPHQDAILGHAGPVPLLIGADFQGIIQKIVLLENNETPSFVRRIERTGFLENWTGLAVTQAAALQVDAVSMATQTSSAIARTVRGRLAQLTATPIAAAPPSPDRFWRLSFDAWDAAIILLIGMAGLLTWRPGFLKQARHLRLARLVLLAASVGVLGFGAARMISLELFENWAVAGRIHGPAGGVLLVLAAMTASLLGGRNVYCHTLCPFGAAQELVGMLAPRRRRLPPSFTRRLRHLRTLLLVVVMASILIGRGLAPHLQEPFSAFRMAAAGWPALILAGLALAVSLLGIHRPWCAYFCSTGALLDALRPPPQRDPSVFHTVEKSPKSFP